MDIHIQKNESGHRPYIFHKNELKIDHRSKCKTQNYKILEDNIGENLYELKCGDDTYLPRGHLLT